MAAKEEIRIVLGANEFRDLVAGKIITLTDRPVIRVILSDIGFSVMRQLINEAEGRGE